MKPKKGLNEVAYQYTHPGKYNLATRNCDHLTSIVARAAGIFYDKRVMPNDSFTYTKCTILIIGRGYLIKRVKVGGSK